MAYPWILAPLISANDQAHNCKGLAVAVSFVAISRALAQAWDCTKRAKGKKSCLRFSTLYLRRDRSGHRLCIHAPDLSTGPWWRRAHRSPHCLPRMNGALSPGDVAGAVMQQTSPNLLVTAGCCAMLCPHCKLSLLCHHKAIYFLGLGTANLLTTVPSFRAFYLLGET